MINRRGKYKKYSYRRNNFLRKIHRQLQKDSEDAILCGCTYVQYHSKQLRFELFDYYFWYDIATYPEEYNVKGGPPYPSLGLIYMMIRRGRV
jgi:hypothetical protein